MYKNIHNLSFDVMLLEACCTVVQHSACYLDQLHALEYAASDSCVRGQDRSQKVGLKSFRKLDSPCYFPYSGDSLRCCNFTALNKGYAPVVAAEALTNEVLMWSRIFQL